MLMLHCIDFIDNIEEIEKILTCLMKSQNSDFTKLNESKKQLSFRGNLINQY